MLKTVADTTANTLDLMEKGGMVEGKEDEIEHKEETETDKKVGALVKRKIHKKKEEEVSSTSGEKAPEEAASSSCLGAAFCNATTFLVLEIVDGIAIVAGVAMVVFAGIMISSGHVDEVSIGLLCTGAALIIVGIQALVVTHFYSGLFGLNEAVKKLEEENEEYSEENDEHRELNEAQGKQIVTLTGEVARYRELNERQALQLTRGEELNNEQGLQIERLKQEITKQIAAHEEQLSQLQLQIEKQQQIYESQVQQIELLTTEGEKYRRFNDEQGRQITLLTTQNTSQKEYIARFSSLMTALQKEGEQFTATGKEMAQVKDGLKETKQGFDRVLTELDQGVKQGMQALNQGLNREIGVFRRLHERLEILEVRLKYLETNHRETYLEVLRQCPSPVTTSSAAAAKPTTAALEKDSK